MYANTTAIDDFGQVGRLLTQAPSCIEDGTVTIALGERRQVVVPTERLYAEDGSVRFDGRFADFDVSDEKGPSHPRSPERPESTEEGDGEQVRVPVARERISVRRERRPVGRVLLHKRIEEEQVLLDEHLEFDEADIERVAVERVVDEVPEIRREGDTVVISLVEERLVKQLVVVEEFRIQRRHRTENIDDSVTLRRQRVDIERDRLDSDSELGSRRPS